MSVPLIAEEIPSGSILEGLEATTSRKITPNQFSRFGWSFTGDSTACIVVLPATGSWATVPQPIFDPIERVQILATQLLSYLSLPV